MVDHIVYNNYFTLPAYFNLADCIFVRINSKGLTIVAENIRALPPETIGIHAGWIRSPFVTFLLLYQSFNDNRICSYDTKYRIVVGTARTKVGDSPLQSAETPSYLVIL